MRFLCKHSLADYLKGSLKKGHGPTNGDVEVVRFYPSGDGSVVCEVEAASERAFQEWLRATGCSLPDRQRQVEPVSRSRVYT